MIGTDLDFDRLVHQAWPAPGQEVRDGWVLRHAGGVTKRANSVLPLAEPADLAGAVRAAEEFYAARGLPCVFSIGPSAPPALDALLARRGYRPVDPTGCLVAPPAVLAAAAPAPDPDPAVTITDRPDDAWLAAWWSVDGRYDAPGLPMAARIVSGVPAWYAAVWRDGRPVAVGRGVPQGDALGVYCMATLPAYRRQGLGRAVLRALLARGRQHGAARAYLLVTEANAAAGALYATEGFVRSGGYHYRVGGPADRQDGR
ncbi:hypothetical protein Sru01_48380 [Sphaerisporangium rufum]|uniref:N-acetyltransferase domain-containing protein n=1 Tax=Sphaerisporangium rufum TaxID=1381558 RepID=A0A919V099_9ACTN|nr:GNAT family N-acetyltransferase [Sphaerisporangium rufum]GII79856.1 hypothetical protein Sru01_48380 [Sphaerisporangium rufum]